MKEFNNCDPFLSIEMEAEQTIIFQSKDDYLSYGFDENGILYFIKFEKGKIYQIFTNKFKSYFKVYNHKVIYFNLNDIKSNIITFIMTQNINIPLYINDNFINNQVFIDKIKESSNEYSLITYYDDKISISSVDGFLDSFINLDFLKEVLNNYEYILSKINEEYITVQFPCDCVYTTKYGSILFKSKECYLFKHIEGSLLEASGSIFNMIDQYDNIIKFKTDSEKICHNIEFNASRIIDILERNHNNN